MIRVEVLYLGKTKERWLREALGEYEKRLKGRVAVEWIEVPNDRRLVERVERGAILLDPQGRLMESEAFSQFFYDQVERGGARVTFVIGGPEGLPEELRKAGHPMMSLSPMTFTHQMTRLVLLEQIYRAIQIREGKPYHK